MTCRACVLFLCRTFQQTSDDGAHDRLTLQGSVPPDHTRLVWTHRASRTDTRLWGTPHTPLDRSKRLARGRWHVGRARCHSHQHRPACVVLRPQTMLHKHTAGCNLMCSYNYVVKLLVRCSEFNNVHELLSCHVLYLMHQFGFRSEVLEFGPGQVMQMQAGGYSGSWGAAQHLDHGHSSSDTLIPQPDWFSPTAG